ITKIADSVRAALPAAGIEAEVSGREKTLFGIYREVITKIADSVRAALPAAGIEAEVSGREKTLFGIYR
ncbi:hypothetical protein CTI14_72340, partial [Methylobacterium radiotolerans]